MAFGFNTRALRIPHDPVTGAVVHPIHQSTTYVQDDVGVLRGEFEYARVASPTRTALQHQLASLEGAAHAQTFPSGLSASDVLLRAVVRAGGEVLLPNDVYGGTYRLLDKVLSQFGIGYRVVDQTDLDATAAAVEAAPAGSAIWVETPTNPMLRLADIAAISELGRAHGVPVLVDSTMASPYLQQPLALGASAVLHSSTKYLSGHSDALGGVVATNDDALAEELGFLANAVGAAGGPFDSWLIARGAKTLGVRMDRHCANALAVAEMLQEHPKVLQVFHPGLPDDPGHELAQRQMSGKGGGVVSFRVSGGAEAAARVARGTELFTLAESLGGVESLLDVPAQMTHAAAQDSTLAPPDDLIRLSVGIEDAADLLADLERALTAA
ncbi:cystathionine gamma-synthase [Naumannella halotolerans]|uniref:homocysteine desulfhydrase n=1 Tax=Naumannella halotolerans TaxID=993414 RepID=A0A4V3ENP7_9ACTN|nr:cystathionine gamma-synthase [Naumannella halotolerans]TDT34558.1 cystathionine gamma-synthase [Naumannella halotolerans]